MDIANSRKRKKVRPSDCAVNAQSDLHPFCMQKTQYVVYAVFFFDLEFIIISSDHI